MNSVINLVNLFSVNARKKRGMIFRNVFRIDEKTIILDLGSESGSNIKAVLEGTRVQPKNVYIADINPELVEKGNEKYGFTPVVISESGTLPFKDQFFDIVFCSSVIEHVTIPKEKIWKRFSGHKFKRESFEQQKHFANEIKRISKQYFVQTPYRYFPIESHTWLPFVGWLPRWCLLPILQVSNLLWIKKTNPDWNLLNKNQMIELFSDAKIIKEKYFGITKSIMALRVR